MGSKVPQSDARAVLLVPPDDWRTRRFHMGMSIFFKLFVLVGVISLLSNPVFSPDFYGGSAFFLSGLAFAIGQAYLAIRRRSLFLLPDIPSLVEECSFFGVRWTRVLSSGKFSKIDVVRGKRGNFYTVQLASDISSAREHLVDLPDLLQAEGFALHLASVLSMPAYVFDFENPMRSDRRFARELSI